MLPPTSYQTHKQPPGSKICGACAAASATGHSLSDVEAEMEKSMLPNGQHYYRTRSVLAYLGKNGVFPGVIFSITDGRRHKEFRLIYDEGLEARSAILIVKSRSYVEAAHMVFWDREHVRDSNPNVPDITPIEDYVVTEVWPLTYLDEREEASTPHAEKE